MSEINQKVRLETYLVSINSFSFGSVCQVALRIYQVHCVILFHKEQFLLEGQKVRAKTNTIGPTGLLRGLIKS